MAEDRKENVIKLDEREVTKEEFQKVLEEVNQDPNRKLKQVSEGVWVTLHLLHD